MRISVCQMRVRCMLETNAHKTHMKHMFTIGYTTGTFVCWLGPDSPKCVQYDPVEVCLISNYKHMWDMFFLLWTQAEFRNAT